MLLRRLLVEHGSDLRLEKTGRCRFRLVVQQPMDLVEAG